MQLEAAIDMLSLLPSSSEQGVSRCCSELIWTSGMTFLCLLICKCLYVWQNSEWDLSSFWHTSQGSSWGERKLLHTANQWGSPLSTSKRTWWMWMGKFGSLFKPGSHLWTGDGPTCCGYLERGETWAHAVPVGSFLLQLWNQDRKILLSGYTYC